MKAESIKIYTRRIASANKSGIILVLYDIIEENLTSAEEAHKKGDKEGFRKALEEALRFVKELLLTLDMKYEISGNLASLYIYVSRCINFALVSENIMEIRTAGEIIKTLAEAFEKVAKEDESDPVMEQTEQLFAGFTYEKGLDLSETMLDGNSANRGYRI